MKSPLVAMMAVAVAAGTTVVIAAIGEIVAERAGVLNLGLEGMMLVGAVAGFTGVNASGSLAVAVLVALAAGAALGLLHAFLTVSLRANQIVAGLALTIFGVGLSALVGQDVVGIPARETFSRVAIPLLADIPVVGRVLFQQNLLVYLGYVLTITVWFLLSRTRVGLHLRAVGESAATADAMGVSVTGFRYGAVVFGGALAGLAGAHLSVALTPGWNEGMTAGRGWIAIGLVIFARWNPILALVGGYLFGLMESLNFQAQAVGINVSPFFLGMLPYLFTVLAVVLGSLIGARRLGAPADLGTAYEREEV
ncbi:MAG TPA: ABC transporter permease [Actinomycetota bacterium]|jgi:simple sugar transport system permease protein|nr:ABC transporter permease [Actinomycetota bacterium]